MSSNKYRRIMANLQEPISKEILWKSENGLRTSETCPE